MEMMCVCVSVLPALRPFLRLPPTQRSIRSFVNDDRHVMAKHSTIYPSSEVLEAVQTLVSTVECALKQVSDWMDGLDRGDAPSADSGESSTT